MDPALAAAALVSANAGQLQLAVAGKMLAMNFDSARSVVKLVDAAQQTIDNLANVSAGIGVNLDITA